MGDHNTLASDCYEVESGLATTASEHCETCNPAPVRPLGIADLLHEYHESHSTRTLPDCWLYCRKHQQAHKVGEKCKCPGGCGQLISREHDALGDCIDCMVGMSEREVMRLAGLTFSSGKEWPALGMEIER